MVHAQSIDSATLYIIHNKAFCPITKLCFVIDKFYSRMYMFILLLLSLCY